MRPVTRAEAKSGSNRNAGAAPPRRLRSAPGVNFVNFGLWSPSRPSRLRVDPVPARSTGRFGCDWADPASTSSTSAPGQFFCSREAELYEPSAGLAVAHKGDDGEFRRLSGGPEPTPKALKPA